MMESDSIKSNAFAVVQLKPGSETKLLRVLLENGYTNVSFTNANGEMVSLKDGHQDEDDDQDEDIDIEDIKENQENESLADSSDDWTKKSISISEEESIIDENNRKSVIVDQAQSKESQLRFPSTAFPYNPFLNPFLSYLPPADHQTLINSIKADMPYFSPPPAAGVTWNPQSHATQVLDTPPSTPRGGGSNEGSNCLITGAKLRQRGRQLRRHERESSAYASCRLCRNRILANRLSNLHNHVRRHAVLKQFHCCYCSYAHTEVAKVRLHMLHNHKDDRSQPLDKRNDDMEAAWSLLMRECFPGYA